MELRDLSGTTIAGKYLVKRRIGAGGMGTVYEGEHIEIGKRVAIKVIEHAHAKESELAQRFRREARAASAVESEHIVQVFDVGHDPAAGLYMVMEMLSGIDLATRIERAGGALPADEGVAIILQAARGLAKAHAAGVVHRDLKPANLFLTTREDGSPCVKILDFGISKLMRPESDPASSKEASLTREGVVMGTPQYMSPEQAQGMPVDARTDVWSLGVVAYEVLSGTPAFAPRDTYEQMIVQIVTTRPKPLAGVVPGIAPELAAVVDATLAHDASSRPDAGTFAQRLAVVANVPTSSRAITPSDPDLRASAHDATIAARPPTSAGVVVQAEAGAGSGGRRTMGIAVGAGALMVAGVLALVVGLKRPEATPGSTGMVAAPLADPPVSANVAPPVTKLAPLETAEPSPSAVPSATIAVSAKVAPAAPPKTRATAATAKSPPASPPQYGAAGVSTSY